MAYVSEGSVMALATRNEIVRQTGECALSLEVIWAAIDAAQRAKNELAEHYKTDDQQE